MIAETAGGGLSDPPWSGARRTPRTNHIDHLGAPDGYAPCALPRNATHITLDPLLASLFLLVGGLLATPVLVALHQRLAANAGTVVTWGALLALVGSVGAAIHGGYDLANAINPPSSLPNDLPSDLPNPVDPRGLLTFGVSGIGLLVLGGLMTRDRTVPRWLAWVGCATGALMVLLYLSRLTVLDPTNPLVLAPAVLTGFVLSPLLYAGLGANLLSSRPRLTGAEPE